MFEALGGLTRSDGRYRLGAAYEIRGGKSLDTFIARVSPVIIIADKELHDYFVQKGNLPTAATREDMNSLIRNRGYKDYKCQTPAPDVFFATNLPARRTH